MATLLAAEPAYLCPPSLLMQARGLGKITLAVAAANAPHVLESLGCAMNFDIIEPLLVGSQSWLNSHLAAAPPALQNARIIDAADEADAAQKAVALVHAGEAQLLMKGHLHTDILMRAVLAPEGGLRTSKRLSHVFAMVWPGASGYLLITDAALNVAPNPKTMLDITRNAIQVARVLGTQNPRIAILSATEEVNHAMPSSVAARQFAESFQAEAQSVGCTVAGPLAFDVAISKHAAQLKGLQNNPVAGQADILVVPNIETGNALFKMLAHMQHATAIGVVLGAKVPIILNSRADPPEAKLASIALARIMAAEPTASHP